MKKEMKKSEIKELEKELSRLIEMTIKLENDLNYSAASRQVRAVG